MICVTRVDKWECKLSQKFYFYVICCSANTTSPG